MTSSPTSTSSDDQTSSHNSPRSPSRHSYKDRSKCSVCQTPVNQCLKKARVFGRDWTTFIVLHGCINPECSANYCTACAMVCTLHETRSKRVPLCRICVKPLYFRSLPKRVQFFDEAFMTTSIINTPIESRQSTREGYLFLISLVVERYRTLRPGPAFNINDFYVWMMDTHYSFTKQPIDWTNVDRVALTLIWISSFAGKPPVLRYSLIDTRLRFEDVWRDPGLRHAATLEGLLALHLHPEGNQIISKLQSVRRLARAKEPQHPHIWTISERIHRIAVFHVTKARQLYVYCHTQTYAPLSATRPRISVNIPPNAGLHELLRILEGLNPIVEDFDWDYMLHYPTRSPIWPHSDFRVAPGLGQPLPQALRLLVSSKDGVPFPKQPPGPSLPSQNLGFSTSIAPPVSTSLYPPPPEPTQNQSTPNTYETPHTLPLARTAQALPHVTGTNQPAPPPSSHSHISSSEGVTRDDNMNVDEEWRPNEAQLRVSPGHPQLSSTAQSLSSKSGLINETHTNDNAPNGLPGNLYSHRDVSKPHQVQSRLSTDNHTLLGRRY
ncbi:hypothetical protein C368_06220 [Cryptococcus neoformans 125.91]|nr:hypothetical protein C368_06220 [Cryptococcus neoformans var. grubii 125.91]OXG74423.1 hypothetical protein C350_05837 [Cryptococcus neoformans var. grubii MW-RSA36]OXL05955.1 hypothetical protein C348_06078 [Cryptococcus neoformans var. grubii Gb118]